MSDAAISEMKTTELLEHLASEAGPEGITIGELIDLLSDRGFGVVQLILSLPVLIPALWGIPQIVALPMLFIALQIVVGRHALWLPQRLRARNISREGLDRLSRQSTRYIGFFERMAKPRLSFLTQGLFERFFGLLMAVFCTSILVPLPGTNTVPGFGVAIQSIGFLERDGVLVLIGTAIGTAWVSLLLFAGGSVVAFITDLLSGGA